ncbi:MAG: hypothetical protein NVSMB18_01310 [Acetobacteraceae bacterium]
MQAVLLFSAVVHIAAVAIATAYMLQLWLDHPHGHHAKPVDVARIAGLFGGGVGVAVALLAWVGMAGGRALVIGIAAGVLASVMLMLFSAVRPTGPGATELATGRMRASIRVFYGTFVLMELVAFCFLIGTTGLHGG